MNFKKTPTQIIVHVTNRCNLSCSYCMNRDLRNNPPEFISVPRACLELNEYISFCHKSGLQSDIYLGGCEATIHPQFKDLVKFIYNKKPDIFTLTTNGRLYTDIYYMFTSVHVSNHMTDLNQEKEQVLRLLQTGTPLVFNYVYQYNDEYIIRMNDFLKNKARIKVFENIFERENKEYIKRYNDLIKVLNIKRSTNDLSPVKEICYLH